MHTPPAECPTCRSAVTAVAWDPAGSLVAAGKAIAGGVTIYRCDQQGHRLYVEGLAGPHKGKKP